MSNFSIIDGTGTEFAAKISDKNRLYVNSTSEAKQHTLSLEEGKAFQVFFTGSLQSSGSQYLAHFQNTSSDKTYAFTYLRFQLLNYNGTTPSSGSYASLGKTGPYVSGGVTTVPSINMNLGSSIESEMVLNLGDVSFEGDYEEFDRYHFKENGDQPTYNKEGSLILTPNTSFTLKKDTDGDQGFFWGRFSYFEISS